MSLLRRLAWALPGLIFPGLGALVAGRPGLAVFWAVGAPLSLGLPSALVLMDWVSGAALIPLTGAVVIGWRVLAVAEGLRPGVLRPRLQAWDVRLLFVIGSVLVWSLGRDLVGAAVAQSNVVVSVEMAPTLLPGDVVLVRGGLFSKEPVRGSVVAYFAEEGGALQFGRVVGLPGERLDEPRGVRVDGAPVMTHDLRTVEVADATCSSFSAHLVAEQLGESRWPSLREPERAVASGPLTIPEDAWFILGDARERAVDSRVVGWIPRERLAGEVSHIWGSTNPCTGAARPERVGRVSAIEASLLGEGDPAKGTLEQGG